MVEMEVDEEKIVLHRRMMAKREKEKNFFS